MKPRIWKEFGVWWCYVAFGGVIGMSSEAAPAAYQDWRRKRATAATDLS